MIKIKYCEDIYPKSVLIKTAYHFLDRSYIHIDKEGGDFIVKICEREGERSITEGEFDNEMMAQCARYTVMKQTKDIREIILARAMASTIIENPPKEAVDMKDEKYDVDNILKDWFSDEE